MLDETMITIMTEINQTIFVLGILFILLGMMVTPIVISYLENRVWRRHKHG